jgi:hypothetical protein
VEAKLGLVSGNPIPQILGINTKQYGFLLERQRTLAHCSLYMEEE